MKRALIGAFIGAFALGGCSPAASNKITPRAPAAGCTGYVGVTIDDGPTATTGKLLTVLRDHRATATFFDVGAKVQKFPDTVRAEAAIGQVANHTYSHPFLDELTNDQASRELLGTNQIIGSLIGTTPILFRPPFDRVNASTEGIVHSLGMTTVLWNIDSLDYEGKDVVPSFARARAGDVILIHDGIAKTNAALSQALEQLKAHKLCTGKIIPSATPHFAWHTQELGDITFNAKVVSP
jgi:peptidoglycan/xylan/chitin deacetylase (PgdA/CDA1 family)